MRILVIGTRGIPDILGGVETHCEELYAQIAKDPNFEITVVCRSCYVVNSGLKDYKGIRLKSIFAPKTKAMEAILHSFLAVLYAGYTRPDVIHIHAVGPNLVAPFARLLGLKVVMTHHGPDYERKKWGILAKTFLKIGERCGVMFANKVIVISEEIKKSILRKFGRKDSSLIPNGVSIKGRPTFRKEFLEKHQIEQQQYIFALGRFVPEKGFDYLIRSFQDAGLSKIYKLVLAGDADHESTYSLALKQQAKDAGVILTGIIKGDELAQLFSNCLLFVLPSFYEGLPIALLESMAYGLPILASDIPANTQVNLASSHYFKVGDEQVLTRRLKEYTAEIVPGEVLCYEMDNYDWTTIAESTKNIYRNLK